MAREILGIAQYVKKRTDGSIEMIFSNDLFHNLTKKLNLQVGSNMVFYEDNGKIYLDVVVDNANILRNSEQ